MPYACPPVSRQNLRDLATLIRKQFHLETRLDFPVIEFLEWMMPLLMNDDSFTFQVIEDKKWIYSLDRHAYYDLNEHCIYIREAIYLGAVSKNGRDRMTIMHECAHAILLQCFHLQLCRSFEKHIPAYRDPEWQAMCLAGELMMPCELISKMTISEVADSCGVSWEAAKYQLSKIG